MHLPQKVRGIFTLKTQKTGLSLAVIAIPKPVFSDFTVFWAVFALKARKLPDLSGRQIRQLIWRRRRDSNPCYAINVNTISNRAPSSTQPLLHTSRLRRTFLFEGVIADATLTIIPYFSNSSREKLQFFDLFFYTQREIADPSAVASLLCGRGVIRHSEWLEANAGR